MELAELMELRPGVIAVIGGSGKTHFLREAGEELCASGPVLLCTTVELTPPAGAPVGSSLEELTALTTDHALVWGGILLKNGRLGPLDLELAQLRKRFPTILVKADSTHGRPLSANQIAVPKEVDQVIALVGATGFGQEIREAAADPTRWAEQAEAGETDPVTPEQAAEVLQKMGLHHRVFVNRVEAVEQLAWVGRFAAAMKCPVAAGSLVTGMAFPCN